MTHELGALEIDFDDWQVLYRQILQVGRAIGGQRQLLDAEATARAAGSIAKPPSLPCRSGSRAFAGPSGLNHEICRSAVSRPGRRRTFVRRAVLFSPSFGNPPTRGSPMIRSMLRCTMTFAAVLLFAGTVARAQSAGEKEGNRMEKKATPREGGRRRQGQGRQDGEEGKERGRGRQEGRQQGRRDGRQEDEEKGHAKEKAVKRAATKPSRWRSPGTNPRRPASSRRRRPKTRPRSSSVRAERARRARRSA